MDTVTVFISYSHDNEEHKDWVASLAHALRLNGINAFSDKWDLLSGGDSRFFMDDLAKKTWVICVCSDRYNRKFDSGEGGVGYEGMIMTQRLLKDASSNFIIPIIRNNHSDTKTPLALGSKKYIDFSDDSQYTANLQELIERLTGEALRKKPRLGPNPFSNDLARHIDVRTSIEKSMYCSTKSSGHVTFFFDNNDGIYVIGTGDYSFHTRWSRAGNNSIHAYGDIGFNVDISEYPTIEQIKDFDFSSHARTIRTGQIVIYKNEYGKFAAIKLGNIKSSGHGHPRDEMEFDYIIYDAQQIVVVNE